MWRSRCFISTLATSAPATTSDTPRLRAAEGAAAPATTIAITTGDNPTLGLATAMMTTRGRSDAGLETTGKGQTGTDRIAITIPAGPTEIATIENAIVRPRMHSADMFTCLAGQSASSCTTAIANTPCAAPNPGRSRPLVHFEWSPVVIFETTRVPGYRDHAVSLTKDGRSLLESHRDHDHEHSQTFYAGPGRERELEHDLQVHRAYEQAEDRLLDRGAHIERVVLGHELKSEYQR